MLPDSFLPSLPLLHSEFVKNLGVTTNSNLIFQHDITSTTQTAFHHLCPSLTQRETSSRVHLQPTWLLQTPLHWTSDLLTSQTGLGLLFVRTRSGESAFSHGVATLLNKLPADSRSVQTMHSFSPPLLAASQLLRLHGSVCCMVFLSVKHTAPHLSNERGNRCRFSCNNHLTESTWDSWLMRTWGFQHSEWGVVDKCGSRKQSSLK